VWYRYAKIVTSKIRGEYWITDSGSEYADGDIGTDNHELIAEDYILNQVDNDMGEDEEWGRNTYENANNFFVDAYSDPEHPDRHLIQEFMDHKEKIGDDDWGELSDYLVWKNTKDITDPQEKQAKKDWVLHMLSGRRDPRKHVIQHHGWIRVEGPRMEVWDLDPQTRQRLTNELEEIYYEQSGDETDSWKDDPVFGIEVISKDNKYIPNVSFYDIQSGKVLQRLREPEEFEKTDLRTVNPAYLDALRKKRRGY
jgi:hypothetical protein